MWRSPQAKRNDRLFLRLTDEDLDQLRERRTVVTRIVIVQNLQEVLGDVRALRGDQHGGVQAQVLRQAHAHPQIVQVQLIDQVAGLRLLL